MIHYAHNALAWWFSISALWEKKYALNLSLEDLLLDLQVHGVYTCIYLHMHKCTKMVIFMTINLVIFLWSHTYYFPSHLIKTLNPIYIYVCSITWVSWQLYFLGVDMYIYTLILQSKGIQMPKRWRWGHIHHNTHFRNRYIATVDFIELLYSILLWHFNFSKCLIQYLLLGSMAKITVMLQNNQWYDAIPFSPDIFLVLYFT